MMLEAWIATAIMLIALVAASYYFGKWTKAMRAKARLEVDDYRKRLRSNLNQVIKESTESPHDWRLYIKRLIAEYRAVK